MENLRIRVVDGNILEKQSGLILHGPNSTRIQQAREVAMSIMDPARMWVSFSTTHKSQCFWNIHLKPCMSHLCHNFRRISPINIAQRQRLGIIFDGDVPDTIRKSQEFDTFLDSLTETSVIAVNWSNPDAFLSIFHRPFLIFGPGTFDVSTSQLSRFALLHITCKSFAVIKKIYRLVHGLTRSDHNRLLTCVDGQLSIIRFNKGDARWVFNAHLPFLSRPCCVRCGEVVSSQSRKFDPEFSINVETVCATCLVEPFIIDCMSNSDYD